MSQDLPVPLPKTVAYGAWKREPYQYRACHDFQALLYEVPLGAPVEGLCRVIDAESYARACMAPLQERIDQSQKDCADAGNALAEVEEENERLQERVRELEARLKNHEPISAYDGLSIEPVEFHWLVELFHRDGNSMGRYHTGLTDLNNQSRSTVDPYQARRYTTKALAQTAAYALNQFMMACEWRAIEHGFHVVYLGRR